MEQSVCMSLPDARPIAHLLLNSSFTARAVVVPRPSNKAPAKADVMFLRIGFVLGVGLGSFPLSFIALAGPVAQSFQHTPVRPAPFLNGTRLSAAIRAVSGGKPASCST